MLKSIRFSVAILILCQLVHNCVAPDVFELYKFYQKYTAKDNQPEEPEDLAIDTHISLDEDYVITTINSEYEEAHHETTSHHSTEYLEYLPIEDHKQMDFQTENPHDHETTGEEDAAVYTTSKS